MSMGESTSYSCLGSCLVYSGVRWHVENLRERMLVSCPWKLPYLPERQVQKQNHNTQSPPCKVRRAENQSDTLLRNTLVRNMRFTENSSCPEYSFQLKGGETNGLLVRPLWFSALQLFVILVFITAVVQIHMYC